ncbi:MAG: septum formation initiator family protein [Anaerovoracaceae bacterium]|nr:septum formation initiator family protein [Anaerovoracaceae bacterium]
MAKSHGRKAKFDKKHGIVDINDYRAQREKQDGAGTADGRGTESRKAEGKKSAAKEKTAPKHKKGAAKAARRRAADKHAKMTRERAILYTVVICIVAALIAWSGIRIYKVESEKAALLQEQQQLTKEKKELREELKKVNDLDYIENQARDKLKMVMPGETLYVLPEDKDSGK